MADVSINLVYNEIKELRKEMHEELHALRNALISEEETTPEELEEIRQAKQELNQGKAVPHKNI
jgi:ATP-dependent Zn protease